MAVYAPISSEIVDNGDESVPLEHSEDKMVGKIRYHEKEGEEEAESVGKKGYFQFQVPPLADCLREEGMHRLKEREHSSEAADQEKEAKGGKQSQREEKEDEEATGPGAAGKLSGANVCARQEP
jgi:hypothetical protein